MPRANPWITCFQPNPRAGLRLVCFPYSGGGPHIFRSWAQKLPDLFELHAIHLPGRGSRLSEPLLRRTEPAAEAIADAVSPLFDKPVAFFGHSLGVLIGFDTARALRRRRLPLPCHLLLSGYNALHLPIEEEPLEHLSDEAFIERLRALEGTPEELLNNREIMELMLPALRADFEMCVHYAYRDEPPLTCPITAFGGLQDPRTRRESLAEWARHTEGPFSLRMLPGNHFFLHTAEPSLLWVIAQILAPLAAKV